jgi:hypothetical protein
LGKNSKFHFRPTVFMKLCLSAFLGLATIGTASSATTPPDQAVVEEVLVTGERPGPGMWRVSKGNHDLWVLAISLGRGENLKLSDCACPA